MSEPRPARVTISVAHGAITASLDGRLFALDKASFYKSGANMAGCGLSLDLSEMESLAEIVRVVTEIRNRIGTQVLAPIKIDWEAKINPDALR